MGLPPRAWTDVLLRVLFIGIPNSRADRAAGNPSCRRLSASDCALLHRPRAPVVRALGALDLQRIGHADELVLGRNDRGGAVGLQHLAARHADDLLHLLSLVCSGGWRLLVISI